MHVAGEEGAAASSPQNVQHKDEKVFDKQTAKILFFGAG